MALQPLPASSWSPAHARHLLSRAGFGVPAERVARFADIGLDAAVDELLAFPAEASGPAPSMVLEPLSRPEIVESMRGTSREEIGEQIRLRAMEERRAIQQLKAWWLERMVTSPHPLQEKLALFWHGHFATSAQKVRFSWANWQINEIFRQHAAGNIKALTIAVGQSPAMLHYLDQRQSTRRHPNENWARELMELFTLGVGNYTEDDIKASARAFTGWSTSGKRFEYRLAQHDPGEKTFLGRTGRWDGWDIIDIIFEEPAAAQFLSAKLWAYFATDNPSTRATDDLAEAMRDSQFELEPVLRTLFSAQAFYAPEIQGAQIKSPAQFLVGLIHDLGVDDPPYPQMAFASQALGQDLFMPPNVKGWDGNKAWINANTLLTRYNLPAQLGDATIQQARQTAMMSTMSDDALDEGSGAKDEGMGNRQSRMQAFQREEREVMQQRVRERLQNMPPAQRRQIMRSLSRARGPERLELIRQLGVEMPAWMANHPALLFDTLAFETAGECIDALAERMLVVPIRDDQRAQVARALGLSGPDAPLTATDLPIAQRETLLRLMTSLAEYQLC